MRRFPAPVRENITRQRFATSIRLQLYSWHLSRSEHDFHSITRPLRTKLLRESAEDSTPQTDLWSFLQTSPNLLSPNLLSPNLLQLHRNSYHRLRKGGYLRPSPSGRAKARTPTGLKPGRIFSFSLPSQDTLQVIMKRKTHLRSL